MRCLDVVTAAGFALCAAACSARSDGAFASSEDAGDAGNPSGDSALATDSAAILDSTVPALDASLEASGPTALVRVANWAPDAPSSGYDVCVATHGSSSWSGPLLA
jgi:hypothetical protein